MVGRVRFARVNFDSNLFESGVWFAFVKFLAWLRCLGATRRQLTRSWPTPSGNILMCNNDFSVLNSDNNIWKFSLWKLASVQTARWFLSISASHSWPRHFRLLRISQLFENLIQTYSPEAYPAYAKLCGLISAKLIPVWQSYLSSVFKY